MRKIVWCVLALFFLTNVQAADEAKQRLAIYQYALYLLPGAEGNPVESLNRLVENEYPEFSIITKVEGPPAEPLLVPTWLDDAQVSYPPPDMELIGYFGRGLSREQALALQDSRKALIVDIGYPALLTETVYPKAVALMNALASEHDSLIWDGATREIFTVQAWQELRINSWQNGYPDVQKHTTIHAYNNGKYVRAITLGMEKFGLPDIVVNDFGWSKSRAVGSLINLVTQALVEGADFGDDLSLEVDIRELKNDPVRENLLASSFDNAEHSTGLLLAPVAPEEGDPENFILGIRFDTANGLSVQEQQEVLLDKLFGSEDSIAYVDHDAELIAASEAAREKLPGLRSQFNDGLSPGAFIYVKAPFVTSDGGKEWMWVEVTAWDKKVIRGLLQNDPFHVPDLRAGSKVTVSMDDVFDYMLQLPDGSIEGNTTGQIMLRDQ